MMKNKRNTDKSHKITTIFGYSLFGVMVASYIAFTLLPFSITLHHPGVRYFNVIILLIVFAVSTFLPSVTSYFFADKATHAKTKRLHHYNGIISAITGYWVALLFGSIGFLSVTGVSEKPFPVPLIVNNAIPVALAVATMAVVAYSFAKKQNTHHSLIEFKPYQIVTAVAFAGTFTLPYVTIGGYDSSNFGILWTLLPFIATFVAYILLKKSTQKKFVRLTDAIIAVSIGWIAMQEADPLLAPFQLGYPAGMILDYAAGFLVLVAYLILKNRFQS